MSKTMKGRRTVYIDKRSGERVTVQPVVGGTDFFYLEVHDGTKSAWTYMPRRKLHQVVGAIAAALGATKRRTR